MRTRPDLIVQEVVLQGERSWVVKDPLAMKFFRLREPEFIVFEALRGKASFRTLKRALERAFPETPSHLAAIQQLVIQMQRMGLLVSDATAQGITLQKERQREEHRKWLGMLASITAMRFPGFDPERLLSLLYQKLSWMFSKWFTCVCLAICLSAGLLVLANLQEFYARLPGFQSFFSLDNLLLMVALLVFTKSVHELGHGLMCKHFGGECHQIGFMLLVFTPAMYCDTSDSWVLPNRWHRIAIGAAGMYVEIVMAACCTFIWWFTHPGWIHYLSLNIMFLCSVSTLMFNANPLMRYDGYFMLSDLLEIPNLSQKARLALISTFRVWALGLKPVDDRQMPPRKRLSFAAYAVSSFAYKWFIMIAIFWFLRSILEPYGIAVIGNVMIGMSFTGMVIVPLFKAFQYMAYPGRLGEVKPLRFFRFACFVVATICLVAFIPLPQTVFGFARVRPKNAQLVTVTVPGRLTDVRVRPGDSVHKGDVIAVLTNLDLELDLLRLEGDLATATSDLLGFELNRNRLLDSERHMAELRVKIRNLQSMIQLRKLQLEKLTLRAERDGIVIQADNVPRKSDDSLELATWNGNPLDIENHGAHLAANTIVCQVAKPADFEASVVVDQSDVRLVAIHQAVSLMLEQSPGRRLVGSVVEISQDEMTLIPRELSQTHSGPIAVKMAADGGERPLLRSYEVFTDLALSNNISVGDVGAGFHGKAKIHAGYNTLGAMVVRYLRNLVNFR